MIKMIMTGELFCTFITIFDIMDDYLLHHCMIIRFIMIDYYHFHKNYDNDKPRHPRKNPRTFPTPGSPQPSDLVFHCHHHNDDTDDDDDDGASWTLSGLYCAVLGPSWGRFGGTWGQPRLSWRPFEPLWGPLGYLVERF